MTNLKNEKKRNDKFNIDDRSKLGKTSILASFEYEEIKADGEFKETTEDSKTN